MIDFTTFALGVRIGRCLDTNLFVVGNPFDDKTLLVRLCPNEEWEEVKVEPLMEAVFPCYRELLHGKENRITVSIDNDGIGAK